MILLYNETENLNLTHNDDVIIKKSTFINVYPLNHRKSQCAQQSQNVPLLYKHNYAKPRHSA